MSTTPEEHDSVRLAINDSVLEAILEVDESLDPPTNPSEPEDSLKALATPKEQPSLPEQNVILSPFQYTTNLVCPPKPVILPLKVECICPSASLSDIVSPDSISQMLMSPLQLDKSLSASSPVVYCHSHMEFNPTISSPITSVSSLLFRSRRPLPTLSLHQDLSVADLMRLKIAVALESDNLQRNSIAETNIPRKETNQAVPVVGLGFDIPTPTINGATTFASFVRSSEARPCVKGTPLTIESAAATSHLHGVCEGDQFNDSNPDESICSDAAVPSVSIANSLQVEAGNSPYSALVDAILDDDPQPIPQYEAARPLWEVVLEGLVGITASSTTTEALVGLGPGDAAERNPQSSPLFSLHKDPKISKVSVNVEPSHGVIVPLQQKSHGKCFASIYLQKIHTHLTQPIANVPIAKASPDIHSRALDHNIVQGSVTSSHHMSSLRQGSATCIRNHSGLQVERLCNSDAISQKYKPYVPQAPMLTSAACQVSHQSFSRGTFSGKDPDNYPSFSIFPETVTPNSSHPALDSFHNGGTDFRQKTVSSLTQGASAGLGLAFPSSLKKIPSSWNRSARQEFGQFSTAEECQNLAKLASEDTEENHPWTKTQNVNIVQRKFGGRKLSYIPEETNETLPSSSSIPSPLVPLPCINGVQPSSNKGSRWLETLRRPFISTAKHASAPIPTQWTEPNRLTKKKQPVSIVASPPPPPTRRERGDSSWRHFTAMISRLSFSSSSGSPKVERSPEGESSPGMIERREVPRGSGYFRSVGTHQKSNQSKSNFIGRWKRPY